MFRVFLFSISIWLVSGTLGPIFPMVLLGLGGVSAKNFQGFGFGPSRFIVWGVGFDIQRGGVLSGYSSKFLKQLLT